MILAHSSINYSFLSSKWLQYIDFINEKRYAFSETLTIVFSKKGTTYLENTVELPLFFSNYKPNQKWVKKMGNLSQFHSERNYYLQNWYFNKRTAWEVEKVRKKEKKNVQDNFSIKY